MSRWTTLNPAWLQEDLFNPWLASMETDKHKARCTVCGINLGLSNMGKQALISHSKGKKHIDQMKLLSGVKHEQEQLKSFFVPKTKSDSSAEGTKNTGHESLKVPNPPTETPSAETPSTGTGCVTITKCIVRDDVNNAEVLWAVKTVMSHFLADRSSNTGDLFGKMFPDIQIAQKFNCGKTKCTYLITHGLAPYFHNNMPSILREGDVKYVISFDESLNKVQ